MKQKHLAITFAILAAVLYAINIPLSKLLLNHVGPTMMAALLYLGAGLGLALYRLLRPAQGSTVPMTRKEMPYVLGMVVLDIAAPILLMLGLQRTNSANASLMNNFEIVATSVIAFFAFRELLSRRLVLALALVTVSSIILGLEGVGSFQFNSGSALILGATCCWGLENNCTRMLSNLSSLRVTTIKGIFSGLGSLIVALLLGENLPGLIWVAVVLILGFVAYGLSINFYIKAQKDLGAAKTSAYYAIAPFLGVGFSVLLLGERPAPRFYAALAIMTIATILTICDTISLQHTHGHTHTHEHLHCHGELLHSHVHSHQHTHSHIHSDDGNVHTHNHGDIPGHDHSHDA